MRLLFVSMPWLAAGILCLAPAAWSAAHPEASSVLILVNDAVPPQAGTGTKGASVFVGEYYAQQRGIPTAQILHLNVPLGCCTGDPTDWDSWNSDWEKFDTTIRQPLKKFLADKKLTNQINYIVPVYGVPVRTWDAAHKVEGLSIDSFLASINGSQLNQFLVNPYFSIWNQFKPHIRSFQNPAGWKMYIVTRLDGPTVKVALGLVDKAIRAEAALKITDGIAYFDYRHIGTGDPNYSADQTVVNANSLAVSRGYQTVFNDQTVAGKMIQSAPKTLWAWGWYSGPFTSDAYEFVDGAVGAQLTSYTANSIRSMLPGTWVPLWLNAGITATWGATTEPYTQGYANADGLFSKFWSGYNFGESAYQATPYLNHAMVFVGDPLYSPTVFQAGKITIKPPVIASATDGVSAIAPGAIATMMGTGLSNCTATKQGTALPLALCENRVTMNGQPAPLFYVSPSQINLLVPRGLTPGQDVRINVIRADGETGIETLSQERIRSTAPGIFLATSNGISKAIVQKPDGSLEAMKLGDAGVLYVSGLGATETVVPDTSATPSTSLIRAVASVQVWVNGVAQNTFFAGLTPGQFGLYQVNFMLGKDTPVLEDDRNEVWLTVDGAEAPHAKISLAQ
jgi:uncharacterized protein (TIGR03437 family)